MATWTMTMRNEGRVYETPTNHVTRLRACQAAFRSMRRNKFRSVNVSTSLFTDKRVVFVSDVITWTLQEVK